MVLLVCTEVHDDGAKMGMQWKSATLPDAVSPFSMVADSATGDVASLICEREGFSLWEGRASKGRSQKTCHLETLGQCHKSHPLCGGP